MVSQLAALTATTFAVLPMFAVAQSGFGRAIIYYPGLGACGFVNGSADSVVAVSTQIFDR
ncbi:hypothetical protein D9758_005345 [Tetrapyrgos nigripes]|uniref:Uncharacterized protein n=1 Tax=Tetrapyrgos nigripes TaxID=182062 RepID=A0A8H5GHP4_9AGAR|nr:hypothetical protein D9758_005345 [Tetrapyrgos nigripes]